MRDRISSAHQQAKHLHGMIGWGMQLHAKQWHQKCHRSDLFSTILLPNSKGRLTIENENISTCVFWIGWLQCNHRTMHIASSCSILSKLPKNGTKRTLEQLPINACGLHATCNHMQVSPLSCRWILSSCCPRRSLKSSMHDVSTPDLLENLSNYARNGAYTLINPRRPLVRCRSKLAIHNWNSSDALSPLDWINLLACSRDRLAFAWEKL